MDGKKKKKRNIKKKKNKRKEKIIKMKKVKKIKKEEGGIEVETRGLKDYSLENSVVYWLSLPKRSLRCLLLQEICLFIPHVFGRYSHIVVWVRSFRTFWLDLSGSVLSVSVTIGNKSIIADENQKQDLALKMWI